MRSLRLVVPIIVLFFAACRQTTTPTETRPSPETTPTFAESEPCDSTSGGTDGAFAHFIDLTVEQAADADVVIFRFRPGDVGPRAVPKFQIDSVEPPFTRDPSDMPMEVEGEFFARIIFHGASGVEFIGDTYRETYTGPKEIKADLEVLVEAEEQGDFEATLSWIMGNSRRSCWRAIERTDPMELEIRFPH